jgi:transcriptional regulator with XRE-family HTH domain
MQAAKPVITGAQIRAARAFLNWSVHDLSERCGVSESAISRAEKVERVPRMQSRNLDAVRSTFEAHGIDFIETAGVIMRPR